MGLMGWTVTWSVLYFMSSSISVMRLWTRYRRKNWRTSDAVVTVSLAVSTVVWAIAMYGGPLIFTTPGRIDFDIGKALRVMLLFDCGATLLVTLSKCCVTLLLLEVEIAENWRLFLWLITGSIVAFGAMNFFTTLFGCTLVTPRLFYTLLGGFTAAVANPLQQKHCVVRAHIFILNGTFNVVHELAIFVCASALVFRLKSTRLQKAGLSITFALGSLTILASIMNSYQALITYYYQEVSYNAMHTMDLFVAQKLWMATESNTGLLISSLLPMRGALAILCNKLIAKSNMARKRLVTRSRQSTLLMYLTPSSKQANSVSSDADVVSLEHVEQSKSSGMIGVREDEERSCEGSSEGSTFAEQRDAFWDAEKRSISEH